ncbi:hypothetical protein DL98DRAFT_536503 [Cadophora sp. DSE1049]|nr:hypothetical protein DL98DRAFT_536503 [Cadophora sp. DSE1049]
MSHTCPDEFDGWEIYPQNLHLHSLDVDDARIARRISHFSKEVFVDKVESDFGYMELDDQDQDGLREAQLVRINTSEKLSAAFKRGQNSSSFFLNQSYTWSRLQICEEHFRKLFTCLKVHPDFLDIVQVFGEKVRPLEESFNGFFSNCFDQNTRGNPTSNGQNTGYNIGYNIKYVARHGRKAPRDPFSVREVGVYQEYSSVTQKSSWVFLQASEQLQEQLRRTFQSVDDTSPPYQFIIHSMILLRVSEDWRDYLNYLEEEFSMLVDRGFYANVKGPQFEGDVEAHYLDIRNLQILTDKLQRLRQILSLNIRLCNQMKDSMASTRMGSPEDLSIRVDRTQAKLDKFLYDQQTSLDRIQTLVLRSTGIGQLVMSLLEIRAAEASKQMNVEMQKLTEQGVNENKLMKRLTEKSTQDTKSMMIIALISAIFLPATFFALNFITDTFWI